jgi:uncharacterized protein (TIGR02594 family)
MYMKKIMVFFLLCACDTSAIESFNKKIPTYPNYLKTADAFVGFSETTNRNDLRTLLKIDPVSYEWCAAFVNAILRVNLIPGSDSVNDYPFMARSFLFWGDAVQEPRMGDIVIFSRGNQGWQGHVGFYIYAKMVDGENHYVILGGNQDDKVSYDTYPVSKVLGIRRLENNNIN